MMLEVTVKTLDGRNRNFCVPDDITVKAFKEKIAHSIEISADTQRLIYQGRVLQDDKILNDHDVNGKTIHVVQKPPPSAAGPNTANIDSDRPQASTTRHHHRPSTVVLGSYSVPTDGTPEQIQNIVQQALGGLGTLQPQGSSQSDPDGTSVDVHINLGPLNPQTQGNTAHLRISQMRRLLRLVHRGLDRLENPPNTSRDGSPMETTETPPSESSSSEDVSSNSQSETQTQPSTTQAEGATERANEQQSNRTAVLSQPPPLSSLDDLLSEVIRANTRLAPFLITYRTLLHDDPQFEPNSPEARSAQRLHLTVSEILHHLGHVNHHLSDCMIDYNSATPRHFRTPPLMPLTPAAVIQQTIPVQAQINVSRVSGSPQTPRRNPQPPPAAGSAAAPTSTSTASSADPISSTTIASGISGPAPPPQSATAPNPLGGLPPGVHVAASSQPYMFVDVSPDGININSVSAHVVTTSGPPPNAASNANNASTAGTGAAQPQPMPNPMQGQPMLPPNMMQNILQMVSNAAMNRPPGQVGGSSQVFVMGPNGQPIPVQLPNQQQQPAAAGGLTTASTRPAAAAATATTAASTSQSNQSAQSGVGGARQAPFMFPGPPPRGMMFPPPGLMAGPFGPFPRPGNERMFDSFLPCSSRFANGGRRGRQRAEAANNNGSQPQPSVPTMNDHGLATMVSNLVSGLVGGNMPPPPPLTTAATSTTISGAAAATATAGENSAAAPAQQPYVLQLRDLLQQGQTTRPTPTSSTTSQTPASRSNTNSNSAAEAPPTQNVTDEVFAQLVSGIGTFVSESARGQTPTTSIADFLNNLGQTYNISQGEGFLTDVFNCVSQHLTFGDLMSVFFGVPDNLRRLRQPLQEFVRDRILRGDEPTDENIRRAVDALLDEAADDIAQIAQEAQARCDIDFAATLRAFANQQLILGIKLIVNSTDDLAFARELHAFIKKCIHEAIVLCRCCLQGGMRDVERLLQSRVQHIANDINPMIQQWMVAMTSQQLQVLTPNITITEDQIQKYIVRRQQQQPAAAAKVQQETVATAAAATSSPASSEMVVSPAPPPSTAAAAQTTSPAHSHSSEASFMSAEEASTDTQAMDVDESGEFGARPRVPPQLLASLPAPPTTAGERLTPLQHGSEDWHRVLPQDWLPVINNDIQRQRRPQQPQAPFSDAYISGMPAKRRRMSSNYKTESAAQVLPPAVERAAAATRSRPVTSLESLTQDLSSDAGLHQAFQRELDQSMQERLSQDPDFIPEKYPNAQKYYKNK